MKFLTKNNILFFPFSAIGGLRRVMSIPMTIGIDKGWLNHPILKLFTLVVLLCSQNTHATHIVGGNLAYEYLGNVSGNQYRYKITFKTYIDCNSPFWGNGFPESFLQVGVYEGAVNSTSSMTMLQSINMPLVDSSAITPSAASNCSVGTSICVYECMYEATVDLPLTFSGYHLFYDRCCRVNTILNLNNPGNQGHSYHAFIPPSLVVNNSPTFSDAPIPFMCVNDTVSILNTAFDVDGDMLIFSFEDPFVGFGSQSNPAPPLPISINLPLPTVTWQTGYNKNIPFGSTGYAYINSSTGYSKYFCTTPGEYVIAVEVKEYRNGNLIGVTRRDFQILVINCPSNPPPALANTSGSGQTSYVITEGDTLCFPIIFYDQFGDSVSLTANGQLFGSSYTNPPAAFTNNVKGDSTVTGNFCWNTVCGQAKALPYLFFVSVTDNGCPHKTTNVPYSIQVNPFLGPTAINGPSNVCNQTTGSTYNVTNITGAVFSWSITGGTQVTGGNSNSISVNWGTAGTGIVQVSTTSKAGCTSPLLTKTVIINPNPTANAGTDSSKCSGIAVNIGSASTIGYTYSWSPSTNLNSAAISNPSATITNTTLANQTTNYIVTVTDANNCSDTDTVIVTTLPMPVVDAGPNVAVCDGGSAQLSGSGGIAYNWTPATGLTSSTIANPLTTTTTSTTFTLEITDTNGCTNSDTTRFTINTAIPVNAGPDTWVCPGDSVQLTALDVVNYQWQPGVGLNDTTINNPHSSPPVTIQYTVLGTDINGCTSIDTIVVSVAPNVPVAAGVDDSICPGTAITLGGSPTAPSNSVYNWTPSGSLNNSTIANPVANPSNSTTYFLTVTNDTCTGRDTITITVHAPPTAFAGNDTSYCFNDSIQLTATGGLSYVWLPAGSLSNASIANPVSTATISTGYTVTVTDNNGCTDDDDIQLTVNNLPSVSAGNQVNICSGTSTTLSATGAILYVWAPPAGLSNPAIQNPVASPTVNTTYTVTGTDINGCENNDTVSVGIITFTISSPDTFLCTKGSVPLIASISNAANYNWSPGSTLSDSTIYNPIASPTVNTIYTLIATNSFGCVAFDSILVDVKANPTAGYTYSLLPSCDGLLVNFYNSSSGATIYNWNFGNGESSSLPNPSHTLSYGQSHTPVLIAENEFACKDTFRTNITINDLQSYLHYNTPNVFTPNFDGQNDEFNISVNGNFLGCTHLKIYNRYGILLFETDKYNHAWDGRTTAGLEVPDGTYFFVYTLKDITLKSFVTLLR